MQETHFVPNLQYNMEFYQYCTWNKMKIFRQKNFVVNSVFVRSLDQKIITFYTVMVLSHKYIVFMR